MNKSFYTTICRSNNAIFNHSYTNDIVLYGCDPTKQIIIGSSNTSNCITISPGTTYVNNNLFVGEDNTMSSSYTVYVNGTIHATGGITEFSDTRWKENIEVIPNALEKVSQISGYLFTRKDGDGKKHAGVLAQEIQKVLPEIVYNDDDGKLSVAYGNISALLIEAIKELTEKVRKLADLQKY